MDEKTTLHDYLRQARAGLAGKIDGLGEYDAHRPLTPTGTNLLGLIKHVASVQLEYLGVVFGRPSGVAAPWDLPGGLEDDDMWARGDETVADVLELHRLSAEHADATIEALPLDAVGEVPWWEEGQRSVTLHRILVHLIAETARHAGHADILREQIDGEVGRRPGDGNIPGRTTVEWADYRARIEEAAVEAGRRDFRDTP
ncbi:DinB family protein [Frondihabitans australicus]|uniref:Putative damage-inducible protein DinB n=1 Tax=Frondihabitans australicus TaxID=386892 RepID=A0A495ICF7_9MICO|nr:DinB family protein [Frondihabitans australicus]RKR73622.1 putative damage-inducible protein DinB [Frondihabitans australicus]